MESLALNGDHVIKPMLFEQPDEHIDFLELVAAYYSTSTKPDSVPSAIAACAMYLRSRGITQIGLLGICWGACIVQHIISIGQPAPFDS